VIGRRAALAGLILWGAAGAGCGVLQGDQLTDAQQVIADLKTGASDVKIVGRVEQADRRYRTGEPIALSFEVNRPAYVAVLRVLPNGVTTRLFPNMFPNKFQSSAQIPANATVRVPQTGAPLTITAGKPGVVLFEFIAAASGESWLFTRKPTGAADFVELGATTRAVAKDLALSLKLGRGAEAATAKLTARIEER
jgi:hypothetical protein